MKQVSSFMLGTACDAITPVLRSVFVPIGLLTEDYANCFEVLPKLESGIYVLLASIMTIVASQLVIRSAESAINDREKRIKGTLFKSANEESASYGCGEHVMLMIYSALVRCFLLQIEPNLSREAERHMNERRASTSRASLSAHSGDASRYGRDEELLRDGWIAVDHNSARYYWNEVTGETSLVHPFASRQSSSGTMAPAANDAKTPAANSKPSPNVPTDFADPASLPSPPSPLSPTSPNRTGHLPAVAE